MAAHSPAFLKLVDATRARVREVTVAETQARLAANPAVKLVDTREDREWQVGHVAGAMHLGKGIIERDIEVAIPDKNTEIILYCGGGFRSVLAADALQQMGYTNVASMAGGWRGWYAAGAPAGALRLVAEDPLCCPRPRRLRQAGVHAIARRRPHACRTG